MVLDEVTLFPLLEELKDTDTTILSTLYADDVAFDGLVRRSAAQLQLLIDRGPDRGYFTKLAKSIFIADNLEGK